MQCSVMFIHLSLNIFCYTKINKMQEKYFVLLCNVISIVLNIFLVALLDIPAVHVCIDHCIPASSIKL